MNETIPPIRAIIGLGNPGQKYYRTRHSIGFRVLDEIAARYGGSWRDKDEMSFADIIINGRPVVLIKPLTYMNSSGRVVPSLLKRGISPESILVVHDELELPFGKLKFKIGGSHRGHNGLRSIIGVCGKEFVRLRFGVSRPETGEPVDEYVLGIFREPADQIDELIGQAADMVEELFSSDS